jgi:hypothetical protein
MGHPRVETGPRGTCSPPKLNHNARGATDETGELSATITAFAQLDASRALLPVGEHAPAHAAGRSASIADTPDPFAVDHLVNQRRHRHAAPNTHRPHRARVISASVSGSGCSSVGTSGRQGLRHIPDEEHVERLRANSKAVESVGDRAKAKPFLDAATEHGETSSCEMTAQLAKRTFRNQGGVSSNRRSVIDVRSIP